VKAVTSSAVVVTTAVLPTYTGAAAFALFPADAGDERLTA
jgi:hypothetical protein